MRRTFLGALLVLAALAVGATAGDEPAPDVVARVTKSLVDADALAEGSKSELLSPDAATMRAIDAVAAGQTEPEAARDRALHLRVALNRAARVTEGTAVEPHPIVWWLALDELDRELPRGPREALLARALPDEAKREASLKALAAGRDVATRFCRDWNEIEHNAAETKKYADLRSELEKAGDSALPYLATFLAVPPHAVFTNLHEENGPTARQQVRALFALNWLNAKSCLPQLVFHIRGPSFTQCGTARATIGRLAGLEFPEGSDEAAQVAAIDAWWTKGWTGSWNSGASWALDHLVRHTLRWSKTALASGKPELVEWSEWGPRQLEHVVGKLAFDPDAPPEKRAAQLAALEREAMRRCPASVK